MSVDWYDLAQRLYAARTGRPVARLTHAALSPIPYPLAARASRRHGLTTLTASLPGQPPRTASGADALSMLATLGVTITATHHRTLLTDDPHTLPALLALAHTVNTDSTHAEVAAHIGWWADRADFPASTAVIHTPAACATRWVTGELPADETRPSIWRSWLDIPGDGCPTLLTVLDRLTDASPLPLLDAIADDDSWAWTAAQGEYADGWDWRHADTPRRAALGLRARCDAADLFASALLADPLYRRRAVHTGHVVTGSIHAEDGRKLTVLCDRMDARLRAGNPVTGWTGQPEDTAPARFSAAVTGTGLITGKLALTLGAAVLNRPTTGSRVTLRPAPADAYLLRAGRKRYQRLYASRRWLSTGRAPVTQRRDVPLDVLIAGAEDD